MADAGRILIIPRGDYNANSTYDKLDLVKYKGTSWLAKKNATGVEPVEGEYWQKIFDLGTANNLTTTAEGFALDARQGKVLDDKITKLSKSNITSIAELNAIAGVQLTASSGIMDIYNAMPIGSKLDGFYVEDLTNYPNSFCRIDTSRKISDTAGLLVWCHSYNSPNPELWVNIINNNKVSTGWMKITNQLKE